MYHRLLVAETALAVTANQQKPRDERADTKSGNQFSAGLNICRQEEMKPVCF
jgi:hypothetical protein